MSEILEWIVGWCPRPETVPTEFVPARVPSAVQLDWAAAHGWTAHTYGNKFQACDWIKDVYWVYQTTLKFSPLTPNQRLIFSCLGVDYQFEVRLNGQSIYAQEGMFTPITQDL